MRQGARHPHGHSPNLYVTHWTDCEAFFGEKRGVDDGQHQGKQSNEAVGGKVVGAIRPMIRIQIPPGLLGSPEGRCNRLLAGMFPECCSVPSSLGDTEPPLPLRIRW